MTATGYEMSHNAKVYPLAFDNEVAGEPFLHDIGGTNASTAWVKLDEFESAFAIVILGTWNATDDLDTCRLEQATSSAGAGKKDLSGSGSGKSYDTDTPIDAPGNFVILEAQKEDLDVAGGFTYVRLYVAETGNTGVDNAGGFLMVYEANNARKQLQGAASAGEQVYVRANAGA